MAPARIEEAHSGSIDHVSKSSAPQSKAVAIQSPAITPTKSPSMKAIMITQGQKQALIDNLQLEITERARKLRAQYALQAQSLRTRIELRVNRIPTAMRKANMGKLYETYLQSLKQPPLANQTESFAPKEPSPAKTTTAHPPSKSTAGTAPLPPSRGTKRSSDHFSADDDKENTPDPTMPLSSKKRPKPNNIHPSNPSMVLSPKSSNSRNIAPSQSPVRPQLGSPQKSYVSHPTSPLKPSVNMATAKPASPAKAAAVAATNTIVTAATEKPRSTRTRGAAAAKPAKALPKAKAAPITRAKRGAPEPTDGVAKGEGLRTVSAASDTSNATTVVREMGKAPGAAATRGKGKAVSGKTTAAAGKKGAEKKVEEPAQGRRVLRKRG
ncbi:MAG: hypothetical protein Q9181_000746 [Wetmoreana brouardii]